MNVLPCTPIRALQDVRAELMLEHTRTIGELHQAHERVAILETKKHRLQERINAVDAAVFQMQQEDA